MATDSKTGLSKNTAAALSYVLGPITGVLFLVLEKDSYVRFHAMQSIVFSIASVAIYMILGFSLILVFLVPLLWLVTFILWIFAIYKAWQGQEWEIPVIGKFARKLAAKA